MVYAQHITHVIEQLAWSRWDWKLAFLFGQRRYSALNTARKMPTALLHFPLILEATPRNRQKNFCLLRC
jgi:hypothetical protein